MSIWEAVEINTMIMIKKIFIIGAFFLSWSLPAVSVRAATNITKFDVDTGMLSVAGSCSGRYVLVVIKNSSSGSVWGSSNPPCVDGAYSYSIAVPGNVRTGSTFFVNAVDNGISGSGGSSSSQPVIFSAQPDAGQVATSITLDASSLEAVPDDVSFLDDALQNFFGIVTSAVNAVKASVVAAAQMFAKIFTILPGGSIAVPRGQNQISGQGSLGAGATDVFIANTAVASSSEIILTPTSPTQVPLTVTRIVDGGGFGVGTISPQQIPVSFTWLIIGTYPAGSSSPLSVPGTMPAAISAGPGTGSDDGAQLIVGVPPSGDSSSTNATGTDITDIFSSSSDDSATAAATATTTDATSMTDTASSSSDGAISVPANDTQ